MQAIYITISLIVVVVSVLLTLIVLVQNSKGGGLAANFAAGNTTFGVRQTADFLEKTTWVLAAVILVLCVTATLLMPTSKKGEDKVDSGIMGQGTKSTEGIPSDTFDTSTLEGSAEGGEANTDTNAE